MAADDPDTPKTPSPDHETNSLPPNERPALTPGGRREVERIFAEACELEPSEWAKFLYEACRGKPNLRADVESLLGADGELCAEETVPVGDVSALEPLTEHPKRIGRYKILARREKQPSRPRGDHLRRAWNWLAAEGPPGFPGALAGDFETVIGALEVEGKEQAAFREFWEELLLAAENSGLHDHAFRYGRLARGAVSAMEAFVQQPEGGEGPGCPAWYAVTRVVDKDPEHGWELILALVPVVPEDSQTFIAVGPFESLLKGHAERFVGPDRGPGC